MICIVDLGFGNLASIKNMLRRIGKEGNISSDPDEIRSAEKLILPGVGAFDAAMRSLNEITGMREALDQRVLIDKVPVLGVCLGMQLMTRGSEEGQEKGLSWVPAQTYRFPKSRNLKVPHMGWNIALAVRSSALSCMKREELRYYFVHSYYVKVDQPESSIMQTTYGEVFDSAFCYQNIYGVQFHPEKSHRFGMQLLKNFVEKT